jgi:hypothetical protein
MAALVASEHAAAGISRSRRYRAHHWATACAYWRARRFLLGVFGWTLWWSLFELPRPVIAGVALALPWLRYAGNGAFELSAETLAFAVVPWALVAVHALLEALAPVSALRGLTVGLLVGSLYWVK